MESKKVFDIISIGDTSLDAFLKVKSASLMCSLDKENCWFCLNYAEKIPVADLHFAPGGNACNNAVGSVRLGLKAALYTVLGDDDSGRRIMENIKKEKVALTYIQVQKKSPTNYSTVLTYKTERTILAYHHVRPYHFPKVDHSKWMYLTSMGKGFEIVHASLLKMFNKKDGMKLAFNPGTHQLIAGRKALDPILKICDVLILNKEEGLSVLGTHEKMEMKEILRSLHHTGPETVVVTDGPHGAYAYEGHRFYRMPPMKAKVVERTGAGDAFSTGLLAALIHGMPLHEALMWGSANSASVIEHIGPEAGLLTLEQMQKRCKTCHTKCKSF